MENPWLRLPVQPDFVLDADRDQLLAHNAIEKHEDHKVRLELLPEPFVGHPEAPVVLLGLNPGFSVDDEAAHRSELFVRLSRANLAHEASDYPFYLLNPSVDAPGRAWWQQRLGYLIKATSQAAVANSVLVVEYFPYHSCKYGMRTNVPSQEYSFELVRRAIARGALVIGMRSRRLWVAAVPELETYERFHTLRSAQNPTLTANNLPGVFDTVVCAVQGLRAD